MVRVGSFAFAAVALAAFTSAAPAAELPSQGKNAKPPQRSEAARPCNVGGAPGVVAANGVCVRLSGFVTGGFGAGQLK
jgi:hypothetical protein